MKSTCRVPAFFVFIVCSCFYFVPATLGAHRPSADSERQEAQAVQAAASTSLSIPGPLRSFLRMAGISQKVSADEVAPLLARNIFLLGYQGPQPKGRPTEFLILLIRYVQQARELAALTGSDGQIHITCDNSKPVLKILGYRPKPDCGQRGTLLETADSQRAFITIDSGFPLPELERNLQEGKPFTYAVPTTHVPALLIESDWSKKGEPQDLLDALLHDPALARFYWALARMDDETKNALRQSQTLKKLVPYAARLDFYGSRIRIRSGRVIVPGGTPAEAGWKDLVGASSLAPGEFVPRLLAKDNGWLAAYFDSLARVNQAQQAHLTQPQRLRRDYEALRGKDTSPDAAAGVLRPDSGLVLLVSRLTWEPNGDPHVPGNPEVWRKIFQRKTDYKIIRQSGKRTRHWENANQLMDAMFAISRVQTETGPLQAYLATLKLDDKRPADRRLSEDSVALLAGRFSDLSDQYLVFSEFPELNDQSITDFLNAVANLDKISNSSLRGNALGTFQALLGMWQILARQGEITRAELNGSWQQLIKPFGKIASASQLFDAGRNSLSELLLATTSAPQASQDKIIGLLAGPKQTNPEGQKMHQQLADRIRSVLEEQRLVSLDTILTLGDALHDVAHVKSSRDSLLPLAAELREFEMPQAIFRNSERVQWAEGIYNNRHTDLQMRTDLSKIIKSPVSAEQLNTARGQLAPFLRDTLVGLNYAYYEPPGAQLLHHNPLFVRSHDFAGETVSGLERVWQASRLFGVGSPAGGGAHLVGSLADLPYVLARTEQDFIAPQNVQALIWREVVPGVLTSAIVPRWWSVSQNELHAISLYQQAGEELLAASVQNEQIRNTVLDLLSERMVPKTRERVERALLAGRLPELLAQLMPADTFYLASEYRRRLPDRTDSFGPAGKELQNLSQQYPGEVSLDRLSRDFGVPHPTFAQSYGCELLNLAPFPAFGGYSNRLLAESWDSNNLYWARLADEKGYSPVMLNALVPELTHRMVEKIFATELEDWPALLRATREAGEEFRQGKIAAPSSSAVASQN